MEKVTALAAVMALSLPLALGLVWLCLRGALRFLLRSARVPRTPFPAGQRRRQRIASPSESGA